MSRRSAGLLAFRRLKGELQVLLVHMGGPFWANREEGAWSVPKGEIEPGEDPLQAAVREFREETGFVPPEQGYLDLAPRRSGDKLVHVWAFEGDFDPAEFRSNTFVMEWPPKSDRSRPFPENDRAEWFSVDHGLARIVKGQRGFLRELRERLTS